VRSDSFCRQIVLRSAGPFCKRKLYKENSTPAYQGPTASLYARGLRKSLSAHGGVGPFRKRCFITTSEGAPPRSMPED
jgi:hypothetical protein